MHAQMAQKEEKIAFRFGLPEIFKMASSIEKIKEQWEKKGIKK